MSQRKVPKRRKASRGALLLGACSVSCSTTLPPPAPLPPKEPAKSTPVELAPRAEPTPEPAPDQPAVLPIGCYSDAALDAAAHPSIEQLAALCAQGMEPLSGEIAQAKLKQGERHDFMVPIMDASRCVRLLVASDAGVTKLRAQLLDRRDTVVADSILRAAFSVLPPSGPLCFKSPGEFRLRVELIDGEGVVAAGAWQANPP